MVYYFKSDVSSTNSEQCELCVNGRLCIDAWLLWKQTIGSVVPNKLTMKLSTHLCRECSIYAMFLFPRVFSVYFVLITSKNLQKSTTIQNILVTLSSVIIAILFVTVCILAL